VIHVHVWEQPGWAAEFSACLGRVAVCTFGQEIPIETQILVKGRPETEEMERLTALRAVVVPFAGIPPATQQLLLNYPDVAIYNLHHNAADTGEMAIALYFAVAKKIIPRDTALRQGKWSEDSYVRTGASVSESVRASGKRALVLGYGAIGQVIAKIATAMGMAVTGVRRSGPFDQTVRPMDELDALLPAADALFIALPQTPETKGLLDERRLLSLPSQSILVNIGRGPIIEEEALYKALKDGPLGGAGLDVWWKYPSGSEEPCFPSKFPIHELPNVVMTPHVGGSSDASEEHRWQYLAELVEGIANGSAKAASVKDGY
jgi:phosphoglycerate dehydrogenase-like enzyme